jgi:hypothetical protein
MQSTKPCRASALFVVVASLYPDVQPGFELGWRSDKNACESEAFRFGLPSEPLLKFFPSIWVGELGTGVIAVSKP